MFVAHRRSRVDLVFRVCVVVLAGFSVFSLGVACARATAQKSGAVCVDLGGGVFECCEEIEQ